MIEFEYIIIFIIIVIILISIYLIIYKKDNFENEVYYDENDNIIDHNILEATEQQLAKKYIKPNDKVLELGARYGTVSCAINKILNNKKKSNCS
jgi:hypothetical protein